MVNKQGLPALRLITHQLTGLLLIAASFNSLATELQVHVHNANNAKPLKNVAVCLGTKHDHDLFGAMRTDTKGNVEFHHILARSRAPLVLTVSSPRYKGLQRMLMKSEIDLHRTIDLVPGGLGPVCDAPLVIQKSVKPSKSSSLRIARVNLDRGQRTTHDRNIILAPKIYGKPSHYRISEDPSFKDSVWQEYQQTPLFTLSNGDGYKRIYYQVSKTVKNEAGTIQMLSNVASNAITLKTQ